MFGAAGAGMLLAGCGGSGGSSSKVALDFWLTPNATPEAMQAYTKRMATGFTQSGSKNEVKSLVIPWESALTKYTAAFSSGNPPDVTYQIVPWLNKFRPTGVLADLNTLGGKDELTAITEGMPKAYLDAARGEKGELYAIPFTQGYHSLAINEDIWEKAGKPALPTTYQEMIPFARALTFDTSGRRLGDAGFDARSVAHWGMTWAPVVGMEDNFVWQYLWAYGSDYISADRQDIGFNNDEGRAALKVMKDMVDSGAVTPPGLYSDLPKWADALVSGRSGMQWMEGFSAQQCKQYPKARVRVIDLPSGPKGRSVVGGCGYFAVSAKSKNQRQAYDLVKFLVGPKQADDYVRMILAHPTRPVQGEFYSEPLPDPRMNKFLNEASSYVPYARCTLILPYQPQEYLLGKLNDYLYGRQGLEEMIGDASKQIKQMAKAAK
jgi:ABC-type glycerol-3-phosphate transport system substrate-binding protein